MRKNLGHLLLSSDRWNKRIKQIWWVTTWPGRRQSWFDLISSCLLNSFPLVLIKCVLFLISLAWPTHLVCALLNHCLVRSHQWPKNVQCKYSPNCCGDTQQVAESLVGDRLISISKLGSFVPFTIIHSPQTPTTFANIPQSSLVYCFRWFCLSWYIWRCSNVAQPWQ